MRNASSPASNSASEALVSRDNPAAIADQINGAFEAAAAFQKTGGIPQGRRGLGRGRVLLDEVVKWSPRHRHRRHGLRVRLSIHASPSARLSGCCAMISSNAFNAAPTFPAPLYDSPM